MVDNSLKSQVLNDGFYNNWITLRKRLFTTQKQYLEQYGELNYEFLKNPIYEQFWSLRRKFPLEFHECEKIYNAYLHRTSRLKKYISKMLNHNCLFLTLTWNEKNYNRQSSITKRAFVKDFLEYFRVPYIANADWGSDKIYKDKNGVERQAQSREHYHAILMTDKIDYSLWKYGTIKGIKCYSNTEEPKALSKYIAKLTNHAIKESTKNQRIIYSRLLRQLY